MFDLYFGVTDLLHAQQYTTTTTATTATTTVTTNVIQHKNTIMLSIPMTQGCLLQQKQIINNNRLIFLIFIQPLPLLLIPILQIFEKPLLTLTFKSYFNFMKPTVILDEVVTNLGIFLLNFAGATLGGAIGSVLHLFFRDLDTFLAYFWYSRRSSSLQSSIRLRLSC